MSEAKPELADIEWEELPAATDAALVRWRGTAGVQDVDVPGDSAYRFRIPPGVAHAVLNTGPAVGVILGSGTEPFDPADPDIVRDILIPPDNETPPPGPG